MRGRLRYSTFLNIAAKREGVVSHLFIFHLLCHPVHIHVGEGNVGELKANPRITQHIYYLYLAEPVSFYYLYMNMTHRRHGSRSAVWKKQLLGGRKDVRLHKLLMRLIWARKESYHIKFILTTLAIPMINAS